MRSTEDIVADFNETLFGDAATESYTEQLIGGGAAALCAEVTRRVTAFDDLEDVSANFALASPAPVAAWAADLHHRIRSYFDNLVELLRPDALEEVRLAEVLPVVSVTSVYLRDLAAVLDALRARADEQNRLIAQAVADSTVDPVFDDLSADDALYRERCGVVALMRCVNLLEFLIESDCLTLLTDKGFYDRLAAKYDTARASFSTKLAEFLAQCCSNPAALSVSIKKGLICDVFTDIAQGYEANLTEINFPPRSIADLFDLFFLKDVPIQLVQNIIFFFLNDIDEEKYEGLYPQIDEAPEAAFRRKFEISRLFALKCELSRREYLFFHGCWLLDAGNYDAAIPFLAESLSSLSLSKGRNLFVSAPDTEFFSIFVADAIRSVYDRILLMYSINPPLDRRVMFLMDMVDRASSRISAQRSGIECTSLSMSLTSQPGTAPTRADIALGLFSRVTIFMSVQNLQHAYTLFRSYCSTHSMDNSMHVLCAESMLRIILNAVSADDESLNDMRFAFCGLDFSPKEVLFIEDYLFRSNSYDLLLQLILCRGHYKGLRDYAKLVPHSSFAHASFIHSEKLVNSAIRTAKDNLRTARFDNVFAFAPDAEIGGRAPTLSTDPNLNTIVKEEDAVQPEIVEPPKEFKTPAKIEQSMHFVHYSPAFKYLPVLRFDEEEPAPAEVVEEVVDVPMAEEHVEETVAESVPVHEPTPVKEKTPVKPVVAAKPKTTRKKVQSQAPPNSIAKTRRRRGVHKAAAQETQLPTTASIDTTAQRKAVDELNTSIQERINQELADDLNNLSMIVPDKSVDVSVIKKAPRTARKKNAPPTTGRRGRRAAQAKDAAVEEPDIVAQTPMRPESQFRRMQLRSTQKAPRKYTSYIE